MVTKIMNAVFVSDTLETEKKLYLEDGIIKAFTEEDLECDAVIDGEGLFVSPGFIDIHTHGAGDHDFGDGTVDDILTAAYAHAKHGTTAIYPTAATSSAEDLMLFVENVRDAMKYNEPGKPYIAGAHMEAPYFSQKMRGAQNPKYIKNPDPAEYREWIKRGEGCVRRISFAPELEGAEELCDYLREAQVVAGFAHTDAIYEEMKPLIDKGCCVATHLYSGMNTVTRRNCYRKLGAVESSFLEDSVTVEVIADGKHLPPELLRLIYKIKGSDKICMVTDSMRGAGMPEGPSVLGSRQDGVACVIKDDVAFLADFSSFAGSVATTDRLVRVMYKDAGIPLCECIKMMCETPARVMQLPDRGKLQEGYVADLVFFDDNINVKKVVLQGRDLQ